MIKLWLAVHKLGQNDLAKQLGMNNSTFSRFLAGKEMDFANHMKVSNWIINEECSKYETEGIDENVIAERVLSTTSAGGKTATEWKAEAEHWETRISRIHEALELLITCTANGCEQCRSRARQLVSAEPLVDYKALAKKLAEALEGVSEWLEELFQPFPHHGSCGPEAGCDCTCMNNATLATRIRTIKAALAEAREVLDDSGENKSS